MPYSCDCMKHYCMPGLPVLHYLLAFSQNHIHWVNDAIQPSHPLSPASSPALKLSQHQVFSNDPALSIRSAKFWSFSFSISSVQLLSHVRFFVTPWTVAHQTSPSITNSRSLLKLMPIESVMPSNLSSSSPPTFNLSQHQGLLQWGSSLHQVTKVLEFQLQHHSFQWTFRIDFL